MKIRFTTSIAGVLPDGSRYSGAAGEEVDLPDETAQELVRVGYAIPLDEHKESPRRRKGSPKGTRMNADNRRKNTKTHF